jgi:brefeldin A-resistance guanine nucleotide exchange factor 1
MSSLFVVQYGDILREGWRNLVECLLQMFRVQLLPTSMMEAEDYIESSGRSVYTVILL